MISFAAILGIVLTVARIFGLTLPWESSLARQGLVLGLLNQQVALISGHAGFDSGAVCTGTDGEVNLTEAEVNAGVTQRAAALLRQAGLDVIILEEYDPQLENLQAAVMVSIHADSCIEASGYKAAHETGSAIPDMDARLIGCIEARYGPATGLPHHANSVTHDMTEYHAFRRIHPSTPAAILELGFLGGDRTLLTEEADRVARGVADSVLCFLEDPDTDGLDTDDAGADDATPAETPSPEAV